jgi:uncharacterized spore protein YtfJ
MNIQEYSQSIMERLQQSGSVKTVYGEKIVAEGKTIIPAARVAYWFGAASGQPKKGEGEVPKEGEQALGGCGVYAKPVGVVEITKDETRFVPIEDTKKMAAILLLGVFLGIMVGSRRSRK